MQPANKLYVIGIGYRPLDKRAKEIVLRAGAILASNRLFEVFKRYDEFEQVKDRIKVINKVPETIDFVRKHFPDSVLRGDPSPPSTLPLKGRDTRADLVLLASGDPLFFGIGRRVCEELGEENIEILPDLSSIQVAFARIGVPWDDAFFISLHGGPDAAKRRKLPYEISDIPDLLERHGKLGVLTDRENSPVAVARSLQSAIGLHPRLRVHSASAGRNRQSAIEMYVCERLGYPDEKITQGTPDEIADLSFSDPNVVIIQRTEGRSQKTDRMQEPLQFPFGLREDEIEHERGLITKDEVRAVTLHKLRLPGQGIVWDVGAGSGSVSLEAAILCPRIRVFAVEKDESRLETMRTNMENFKVSNVSIIRGSAPDALAGLPAPDRVFIGGSGGDLEAIVKAAGEKMRSGIIVINAATLETLNSAQAGLEKNGFSVEVSQITVARSKEIAGKRHMTALNPVFIVKGEKLK